MLSNKFYQSPPFQFHLTEIIHLRDSRAWMFNDAKTKELEGLVISKTWKIVSPEEVPPDANIRNGIFALANKDEETKQEIWKARLNVQGHRNCMKESLVHNTSVARN